MDAVVTAPTATDVAQKLRCARCGIESAEPSCFIVPGPYNKNPRDTRCITCEQHRLSIGVGEGITQFLRTMLLPLCALAVVEGGLNGITVWTVLAACCMGPIVIIAHELGHTIVGRLVGLEVNTVVIGVGPRVWRETIFGTCFTLRAWPLSGLTFLGARNLDFLRTRLWLATLAGPMTNVSADRRSGRVMGAGRRLRLRARIALDIHERLTTLSSILPHSFRLSGETLVSDGLALLQIPRRTAEQLEPHLFTGPLLRAFGQFEDGDFANASAVCTAGLQRVPDNVHLRVLLSGCHSYTHDYAGALKILEPLLQAPLDCTPGVRAAIENNVAFALLMSNPHATHDSDALRRADQLSARVFALFPCVFAYRSTRALVLTARGRPEEALALLAYPLYDVADRTQRGHRETARALALRALDRLDESRSAAEASARLTPATIGFLSVLGLA